MRHVAGPRRYVPMAIAWICLVVPLPIAIAGLGDCPVPVEAQAADTSIPDIVVGDGTPASCTSAATVDAIAQGGIITFDCGPDPITIVLQETAKIFNNTGPEIVIDGGGKITLSGGGLRRLLYMNTCDPELVWTTPHCFNQDHPRVTVQNLTFTDGNAIGADPDGGGAIYALGGRLKIVNSTFSRNVCDPVGPDVGGAAVRALQQFNGLPLYVVNSTFGGAPGDGNSCSNGGGLGSIGVSYTVINSLFSYNEATGEGGNPPQQGTPGGGSGGAIYNDGNSFTLTLCGTAVHDNTANEFGGAIFFVSNDHTGAMVLEDSAVWDNPGASYPAGWQGMFILGDDEPQVSNSLIGSSPAAGQVGATLRVDKLAGGQVQLDWQESCLAGGNDYAVYAGPIGDFATYAPLTCSTSQFTDWISPPGDGADLFFLIVPQNSHAEGGYGAATAGQRSALPGACHGLVVVGSCPSS